MAPNAPPDNVRNTEDIEDEFVTEYHAQLEERKIEIDIPRIINDLRNLDWSKVVWKNLSLFVLLHIYSIYGLWLVLSFSVMWQTLLFCWVLYFCSALGITMGAHRLWSHRSYKAKLPLRIFLAVAQSVAFQNSIFEWSRDHRVHHKCSETDGDPHNAKRGFFFSHMGWLMYRKHPDVIAKGRKIDVSDLLDDPVVAMQKKYYLPSVLLLCFAMPIFVPWYYWGEDIITSIMVPGLLRYCICLHITWCVNSLAHWVGSKPYDKNIYPSQNQFVAFFAIGEGWHNYHHVFPWDYKTAELGTLLSFNATTRIIDFFAFIGQIYDRKTAQKSSIVSRVERTGDDTHPTLRQDKTLMEKMQYDVNLISTR